MISGGNATVYVSDLEVSLAFYVEKLGLKLVQRFGAGGAEIDAGGGLRIVLHPAAPAAPRPGTSGAITVGFAVSSPLEQVVAKLRERGVWFRGPIVDSGALRMAFFGDPDGNDLYVCEPLRAG
jgi:catechol 2,3-dioxygenase-like lactoylglutathione lyase family enzyme